MIFFANGQFSIVEALIKLILVITGSALIICLCHKLTNYKKTRRYKYNIDSRAAAAAAAAATSLLPPNQTNSSAILTEQQQQQLEHQTRQQQLQAINVIPNIQTTIQPQTSSSSTTTATILQLRNHPHQFIAYDPYNTIRPFACLNNQYQSSQSRAGGPLEFLPNLASAYGFAPANYQNLHHQGQNTIITNPAYTTTIQPDCSSFRATQLPLEREASCPSYEDATRESEVAGGGVNSSSAETNRNQENDEPNATGANREEQGEQVEASDLQQPEDGSQEAGEIEQSDEVD